MAKTTETEQTIEALAKRKPAWSDSVAYLWIADGTEHIYGTDCVAGQLIFQTPSGTEVFDSIGELISSHPVVGQANLTHVYVVASHNKGSNPDGRERCFSGSAEACDRFYNDLTHMDRIDSFYLFGEDEESAVGYQNWEHAGCSE